MHGLMSYRRFGRARSLRSDRTGRTLGRYVATERDGRSVAIIPTKLYLGNIHCDVFLTEHDLLRKDILVFCGDLDVNFIVTVFDPNIRKILQHKMSPYLQPENADRHVGIGVSRCMHSIHAASHGDVGVSLYMSLSHASRHVCARLSPRMRPEACRLTYRRSCGAFSLASDFYKYPTLPSVSDIHSTPKPLQKRGEREREREREREWLILKTDTPPRRPVPSNRRFSTIVMWKLCPYQSVHASYNN
ncbi:hypothetical protein F2Q69_00046054 [Brassica cretica]|uniref:Uncharacterized protein n=1 Tax=Brassica cretica TaxID=69181 RepID=A0A8S9PSF6_BRACR|nr:hypothetical protein F2Q69_00046054 [Brassica cretica]